MDTSIKIEDVRHLYNNFNIQFFNGRLPLVSKIMFIFNSRPIEGEEEATYAGYTFVNGSEPDGTIVLEKYPDQYKYVIALNDVLLSANRSKLMSTLAHEMIHIYQLEQDFEKYSAPNTWHMQHNRLFVHKMDFINATASEYGYDMHLDVLYTDEDDHSTKTQK